MDEEQKALTGRARSLANLEGHKFKPGQSGNPSGRPKNALTQALRTKLQELESGGEGAPTNAEAITAKLVELARGGNLEAIKIVLDRVEGRPRQSISLDTDEHARLERKLQNYLDESERVGDPMTREQAIAVLAEEDARFEGFE